MFSKPERDSRQSRRSVLGNRNGSKLSRANIEVTLVETILNRQEGLNPGFSRLLVKSGIFLINARSALHAIQFLETGVSRLWIFRLLKVNDSEFETLIFCWDASPDGPPRVRRACSSAWLERPPDKREVGGSSPPRPTIFLAGSLFSVTSPQASRKLFPASRWMAGVESEDQDQSRY